MNEQGMSMSKRIEETEISHVRTEQIIASVLQNATRAEKKLEKIKNRLKNLLGDSLLLACTVAYMGPFSMNDRRKLRKEIAEGLSIAKIETSHFWLDVNNAKEHSKLFKQILKESGFQRLFLRTPKAMEDNQLAETLFTSLYAPSTPVILDSSGVMKDFFENELFPENSTKMLHASDHNIQSKLNAVLRSRNLAILLDCNDLQ
jgi:hypothetical protein